MNLQRINFDEYLLLLAQVVKLRSQDVFRQVGVVCASSDNRILSCGYNGLASKFDPPNDFYLDRENVDRELLTYHGELNALMLTKRGDVETIALTCSPCRHCAKMIAGYRIRRVIYSEEYSREQEFKKIFDFYCIDYNICALSCICCCAWHKSLFYAKNFSFQL